MIKNFEKSHNSLEEVFSKQRYSNNNPDLVFQILINQAQIKWFLLKQTQYPTI